MINEACARNSITHTSSFEYCFAFYEELQIAIYVVSQIKIICQIAFGELDLFAWPVWMIE